MIHTIFLVKNRVVTELDLPFRLMVGDRLKSEDHRKTVATGAHMADATLTVKQVTWQVRTDDDLVCWVECGEVKYE